MSIDKSESARRELADMSREIESLDMRGEAAQSAVLQSIYLDRVYEGRQRMISDIVNDVVLYLGDPEVMKMYPSLMDAVDGNVAAAAKYVIWIMTVASADGINRGLAFWCREVETCFAKFVHGGESLRFL